MAFHRFFKRNYELLIELLPKVVEVFSSEKIDSEIKSLLLRNIFDLKNDDYAHLGLPPLLLKLTDLIGTMDKMLLKFISEVKNFTSCKGYEIGLKKQIYLKLTKSLDKIVDKEAQKLFVKQLIETVLDSENISIVIKEILSHKNKINKIDFMEETMKLMVTSPHNNEINEIWIQISKLLPSFTIDEQLMFLAYSFDLIDILKLQESLSFKPVVLEINKFINRMNPINQLELFNKLKSMDISKIIFSQALNLSDSINVHNYLEEKAQEWLIGKVKEKTIDFNFTQVLASQESSFIQKFISKLFTSENSISLLMTALPNMHFLINIAHEVPQRTFLIETFSRPPSYLGTVLEKLLELRPSFFSDDIRPENHKYVNKYKIFVLHKTGAISDELYNQIIHQLGGEDKFFDPSLKLVISEDIDPIVKKLFDKTVYSKDIEDRLHDIALTLDSLIKTDTSGLMRTILEAADLPGKFLMHNDLYSTKPNTWIGGKYFYTTKDITIYSMEHRSDIEVARTIIHELTHKLLKFIFNNSSNPYYYGNRLSLEKSSSLTQILKEFEPLSQKHSLFSCYNKDKWSKEVISHLFEDLADQILTGEASESVLVLSEKLNNWVKDYLKQEIQDFDAAYEVLGSKILTEYSSQQVIFKHWSLKRIDQELEKISNIQKTADTESPDSFDITGTILGYLEQSEETTLEVAGES
jgi:hypothetical protein